MRAVFGKVTSPTAGPVEWFPETGINDGSR